MSIETCSFPTSPIGGSRIFCQSTLALSLTTVVARRSKPKNGGRNRNHRCGSSDPIFKPKPTYMGLAWRCANSAFLCRPKSPISSTRPSSKCQVRRLSADSVSSTLIYPRIPSYEFGQAKRNWMKKNTIVFEALATAASHRLFREDHQTAEAILGFSRSPRSKTPPTLRASD